VKIIIVLILKKRLKSFAFFCVCRYLLTAGLFRLLKLIIFPYPYKLNFSVVATFDIDQY